MGSRNRNSGFVALFDVLGFSERVVRNGLGGLDRYIDTVVSVTDGFKERIDTILFSDTVVLYTSNDHPPAFEAIRIVSSRLLHALIMSDVAVRGAISHGEFVRSEHEEHGTVLAGRPIIDAHHYEAQLQWIGVMIAPQVLEHVPDLPNRCDLRNAKGHAAGFAAALDALMVQPCKEIPLEPTNGPITPYDGFTVVPLPAVSALDDILLSLKTVGQKLEAMKRLAPEARSQSKYRRTIDWLELVRNRLLDARL